MKLNTKPLAEVEVGFTNIQEGPYFVRIEKAEVKPNSKNTGNLLAMDLVVLNPTLLKYETGEPFENNNYKLFFNVSLVPTEKWDPNVRLREIADAIGNSPESDLMLEDLPGKIVKAIVKYRAAEGSYPARNEVSRLEAVQPDETVPM